MTGRRFWPRRRGERVWSGSHTHRLDCLAFFLLETKNTPWSWARPLLSLPRRYDKHIVPPSCVFLLMLCSTIEKFTCGVSTLFAWWRSCQDHLLFLCLLSLPWKIAGTKDYQHRYCNCNAFIYPRDEIPESGFTVPGSANPIPTRPTTTSCPRYPHRRHNRHCGH